MLRKHGHENIRYARAENIEDNIWLNTEKGNVENKDETGTDDNI